GVAFPRTADKIGPLNGGSRGASTDNATALQHCMNFALGTRAEVGIYQPPLTSAFEPDASGGAQRSGESFGLGDLAVAGVEADQILGARFGENVLLQPAIGDAVVILGGRDDDDRSIGSAGKVEEAADDFRTEFATTDHDKVAFS